jgi:uncharacterized membrane protein YhhN
MAVFLYLVTLSAFAQIFCDYRMVDHPDKPVWRYATYVFKPLTMLLIIAMLLLADIGSAGYLVFAALLFSLLGDIFLMLPKKPLLPGLLSFLIAHILFVVEFAERAPLQFSWPLAALGGGILVWAAIVGFKLIPKLGVLLVPGIIYFTAISSMLFLAGNVFLNGVAGGGLLIVGALLFFASDTSLAFNRFGTPWRSAQCIVLATYFSAQFLITASVLQQAEML